MPRRGRARRAADVRRISSLRDGQGMSFRDIASRMGLSAKVVRERYYADADADADRVKAAGAMYKSGLRTVEIAAQLGIHQATIARWIGMPPSPPGRRPAAPRPTDALIQQLVEQKGMTFESIGKAVGLSPSGAWRRYARSLHPLPVRSAVSAPGAGKDPKIGPQAVAEPRTSAAANDNSRSDEASS
jgi:transposase